VGLSFGRSGRRAPLLAAHQSKALVTASIALAHFLLNRFQPFSESAVYGAGFSGRDSSRGDLVQYPALKRCDLIQRHLLDLSYARLNIGIYSGRFPVAHDLLPW
jgi:hypothetical protein